MPEVPALLGVGEADLLAATVAAISDGDLASTADGTGALNVPGPRDRFAPL